jgi:hypothetical protein
MGSSVSIILEVSGACRVRSGIAWCWLFDARDDTVLDRLGGPDEPLDDAVDA